MTFKLRPILSEIKEYYSQPISRDRFEDYISKLQGGTKGDLKLPISGFNPMAKNHILDKIAELEALDAEALLREMIQEVNSTAGLPQGEVCLVVLNIADDLKGGWTNFYSTDYESKFKLNAFMSRNFCVPYFWTSEQYSPEIIKARAAEYLWRTVYWKTHSRPTTVADFLEQEVFVAGKQNIQVRLKQEDMKNLEAFLHNNWDSDRYDILFNFFYGDKGAEALGYPKNGIQSITGFDYAKYLSKEQGANNFQSL